MFNQEAVAVIFIAQLNNVQLSLLELLTIRYDPRCAFNIFFSFTTTVASIGSGSVPAGKLLISDGAKQLVLKALYSIQIIGLDTIIIVLTTVGLPAKDLSLLLTVDWLL